MVGPAIAFVGVDWLLGTAWMRLLVYMGIALMVAVLIWDLASPAYRRCGPEGCEPPTKPNESTIQ
jgi:mercuric ion transport protein